MTRAPLSTVTGKERLQLIVARHRMNLSQQQMADKLHVGKTTVHKWEREGVIPQPYHLQKLCELCGISAQELGFTAQELGLEETTVDVQTITEEDANNVLEAFRKKDVSLCLTRLVGNWSRRNARYHMLQIMMILELKDNNAMNLNEVMNRRDAVKRLVVTSIDVMGLYAIFKSSQEEVLVQCAAGITACWYLRRGEELLFTDQAISKYIPPLKGIVRTAPEVQRKAAADLLAQCLLLKATLAWDVATTYGILHRAKHDAIHYAQEAEFYCAAAENRLLMITTLRLKAAAFWYANQWKQALETAQQAKLLLEEKQKFPEEPLPQLVYSYVYSGLATYQAHRGYKQDAIRSIKQAHDTFLAQPSDEVVPLWIDHSIGNLYSNDGSAYTHLGLHKEAIEALAQIDTRYATDLTIPLSCRVESITDQVVAEASRDDNQRDMQRCVLLWEKSIEGAKTLQSERRLNEAIQAYRIMCAAWPGEKPITDLRDYIVR